MSVSITVLLPSQTRLPLRDGTSRECGFWAEELTAALEVFTSADVAVVFATPDGRPAAVEPASIDPPTALVTPAELASVTAVLEDHRTALDRPEALADLDTAAAAGIFVPGGYGPTAQFADSVVVGATIAAAHARGQPIAAVCHGAAALLPARTADGSWPFSGLAMTCFSNAEEEAAGAEPQLPYLLQNALTDLGARYSSAPQWASHVVSDGTLITGQNPASSAQAAQSLLQLIHAPAPQQ